jgi:hypothetical protein
MPPYQSYQPRPTAQGFRMGGYQSPSTSIPTYPITPTQNPFGASRTSTPFGPTQSRGFGSYPQQQMPQFQRRSPTQAPGMASGWSGSSDPLSSFLGGSARNQAFSGRGDFTDWALELMIPQDGVYGDQKWAPGNGTDVFTRRGFTIRAPADGMIGPIPQPIMGPGGPIGGLIFSDQSGKSARMVHVQPMGQARRVRKGEPIAVVNDPQLDMLGPYQGMPDGFQNIDLAFASSPNGFSYATPGVGGDVSAQGLLSSRGLGRRIPGQTRGPNGGPGGGGGMMGMPGGMMGGMPGMGMGMPPNPFMMMMQGGRGGPPMGPMGMGGFGGPGGGMGFGGPMGPMGMNPFMMGGMRPF